MGECKNLSDQLRSRMYLVQVEQKQSYRNIDDYVGSIGAPNLLQYYKTKVSCLFGATYKARKQTVGALDLAIQG